MLTLPLVAAAASAGLVGGVHCAGMCGGITSLLGVPAVKRKSIPIFSAERSTAAKRMAHAVFLHGGRLSSYAAMGAVAGALGGAGLLLKPVASVHVALLLLGNAALIFLGLQLVGWAPHVAVPGGIGNWAARRLHAARGHPLLSGMVWGCMPCGLLYGVLPFALLSGDAWSGAILMLIFGLGALPYLLFAQWAAMRRHAQDTGHLAFAMKGACAAALIGLGLFGLAHFNSALPGILCVTPQA